MPPGRSHMSHFWKGFAVPGIHSKEEAAPEAGLRFRSTREDPSRKEDPQAGAPVASVFW